jgi:anti-sigma B factor antagonist
MDIQIEPLKRCYLVKVSGRLDSASAPKLEETLLNLVDEGVKTLVVNLSDIEFISSAGLTALLRARIRLQKKIPPGEVILSEVPPKARETIELVGLHHLFQSFDTDALAIGHC